MGNYELPHQSDSVITTQSFSSNPRLVCCLLETTVTIKVKGTKVLHYGVFGSHSGNGVEMAFREARVDSFGQ